MSVSSRAVTHTQPQPSAPSQVRLRALTRRYEEAGITRTILDNVDLDVATGEFAVLLGKSGSGKSTLLNLIGGLDRPTSGEVWVGGTQVTALNERALTLFRREQIGYVFQFFNLIPTLTVLENVMLPYELRGRDRRAGEQKSRALLARVGLDDRAGAYPDRLSGGEQQRVALARALVHSPALILADEPTGNLDEDTGQTVLKLLLELTREAGKTLIIATHSADVVAYADAVYHIHDGKLIRDPVGHPTGERVQP
ncbi:MAG: ABC transporter ATP-binding protein [Aggregatilineales bacterium]